MRIAVILLILTPLIPIELLRERDLFEVDCGLYNAVCDIEQGAYDCFMDGGGNDAGRAVLGHQERH